jgi:hypothetical protein
MVLVTIWLGDPKSNKVLGPTEQRTRIERGCLFLPGSSMGVL